MNTNKKVSTFDKPYSEEVARLYIMSFFPEFQWNLKRGEMPDLMDEVLSVGIEVTAALDKVHGELDHQFENYVGTEKSNVPQTLLKKFDEKYLVFNDDHGKETLCGCVITDISPCTESIPKAVERKLHKLRNYESYNTQGVLVDEGKGFCVEEQIVEIVNAVQALQKETAPSFDYLFVKTMHAIYCCDLSSGMYKKVIVTDEDREQIRMQAIRNLGREQIYENEAKEWRKRVESNYEK